MEDIRNMTAERGFSHAEQLFARAEELSYDAELQFICWYVKWSADDYLEPDLKQQLRALWTAFCLHFGLDADTSVYDSCLRDVWVSVTEAIPGWGFDEFDNYMAELLV